ncbi:glycosyltransferase family 9 protein [Adhaeribacter rhizoryzae]|uniref:Glycosyltransferase family 9 protein n=1 Tax=Adhaeribacter rhizoryzae TaxID=2607907 RepID=A0A5M6DMB4_9BACT|nr:glycosyltransferase family 9 protein [Adhaeribacter rhizoryzae]KAA5547392.1 glycosyltransferase family 9 protein [Adhaeribacter rhizoryzae]
MPEVNNIVVNTDCIYFRGDIPCKPNKEEGYHCGSCPVYTPVQKRILIIKLGAIGDVIRTTPLIRKIRSEYPNAKITWLTHTPAILPKGAIDEILKLDLAAVLYLQNTSFDLLFNLDKDKEACALHDTIRATEKYGYRLENGVAFPSNHLANHKYLTGIFDDISLANKKSYVAEIFEICGWQFNGEEYIFDNHEDKGYQWPLDRTKPLIGLNTGCGDRWTTRLWSDEKWVDLIQLLQQENYTVVLLGGEQEDARNRLLQEKTGATYFGYFKLEQFINLMHQMDVIVTQVTMAMHISIALRKKIVLMNNIFNAHEFELYGRGFIVQPNKECACFYRGTCKYGVSCMEDLPAAKVFSYVQNCLNAAQETAPIVS